MDGPCQKMAGSLCSPYIPTRRFATGPRAALALAISSARFSPQRRVRGRDPDEPGHEVILLALDAGALLAQRPPRAKRR